MSDPLLERRSGALKILRLNWPWYAAATLGSCLAVACASSTSLSDPLRTLAAAGGAAAAYFVVASLLASHWVYDRSGIYELGWLTRLLAERPARWINVHAGLDETSGQLQRTFPDSWQLVVDIHRDELMTEPAIARARSIHQPGAPSIPSDPEALPIRDDASDAVFLIFSAHEIRDREARQRFFREIARVTRPDGVVILVEHLRDLANLLAFGPGALHFYPRADWLDLASTAGLRLERSLKITPYVEAFAFVRPPRRVVPGASAL